VTVMNRPDANGNATPVGEWRVTEVRGSDVRAFLVQRYGGEPSEGMAAFFTSSRGPGFREGPDVDVPGSASSGVPGKVTEVRGEDVTIRLDRDATPAIGDMVELSYAAGEDTISMGTWRVTGVRADGRVDARPDDALGQPTPRMDAVVFATGDKARAPTPETLTLNTPARMTPADELFEEAMRYQEGRGVAKDETRALRLFEETAGLGHSGASEQAGNAYDLGLGTQRDDRRAVAFYRQAAEAGRPLAQNNYAAFLATVGVPGFRNLGSSNFPTSQFPKAWHRKAPKWHRNEKRNGTAEIISAEE